MVSRISSGVLWVLFLVGFSIDRSSGQESAAGLLQAGASAVCINPESMPVESAGSMTPRMADWVHDDLMARCLVLDNGQDRLALVICDSCMISREIFDNAKQLAFEQTGIPTNQILCAATHTHTAVSVTPVFQSGVEAEYAEFLRGQIAQAISQADSQKQPARIGWALGSAPQHVFNRRWFLRPGVTNQDPFDLGTDQVRMNPPANHRDLLRPAGPTDPELPVLAVQTKDGEPIAVWVNYALHYVGGVPAKALSADYFGEFARQMAALIQNDAPESAPIVALTNGTSGDINNVNFFEGSPRQAPFEQIRLVASEVAGAAYRAYQRVTYHDWVPLAMHEAEVELAVRKPTGDEVTRARSLLDAAGPGPWSDRRMIYAGETLDLLDYPETVSVKLQAIRIGDLGITAAPCEMFVETGLALKRQSPLQPSFTIELANGYNGYLPTPEQHSRGGYETWRAKSSYLAVDAEPKIRSILLESLQQVARDQGEVLSRDESDGPSRKEADPPPTVFEDVGAGQQPAEPFDNALASIEKTRGGRHWADAATEPALSPEQSWERFQIEPGWRIELVAAEPMVMDPVWITFDHQGRMFVVEYADYPEGPANPQSPPLSRIVMLEDTDGDGRMDRRDVFADHLDFAHSAMAFRDGLLVGTKEEILYLKDSDGDRLADVREVLFRGFQSPHPQMQIGCPQWGIDNWITLNYGRGKVQALPRKSLLPAEHPAAQADVQADVQADISAPVSLPNRDFRFHPLTFEWGSASGFGQFGNTVDIWGNRFFCTNRNPVMAAPIAPEQFRRNPLLSFPIDQYDVAPSGGDSVVHPIVEIKSNYLSHAGTYTSACGTTAYLAGHQWPELESGVFVCEPIGHLVTRYLVQPNGAQLVAKRARAQADFLASTDTWFRPVSLANGPDGALYLADMYRLWVEHPRFLPQEVAQKLDWRAGEDRGRIWRIVPADWQPSAPSFELPSSAEEIVNLLQDSNGWRRQLAQRLTVERQSFEAIPELRRLILADSDPFSPQHSLWTLHGLGKLSPEDVARGMQSKFGNVRLHAVRLTRSFPTFPSVVDGLLRAAQDDQAFVRFQAALALGDVDDSRATEALARIAIRDQAEEWTVTAILTSAGERSSALLSRLLESASEPDVVYHPQPDSKRLIQQLSEIVGVRGQLEEVRLLLEAIGSHVQSPRWWQMVALDGLAAGLSRSSGPLGRLTISKLVQAPPESLERSVAGLQEFLLASEKVALDPQADLNQRLAAASLLSYLQRDHAESAVDQLLSLSQPSEIQLAALEALKSMTADGFDSEATLILRRWPMLKPQARSEALKLLLGSKAATRQLLSSFAEQRIEASILSLDQRAVLLTHPDPGIMQLAQSTLGRGVSVDRQSAVEQYRPALDLPGHASTGRQLFERHCAVCHRFRAFGQQVGPDISDAFNRSKAALLVDILDPNQKVEPLHTAYQVLTDDGKVFQGLLASESAEAIVLKLADGKEAVVQRSQIEQMQSTGKSLMPEGFEKEFSQQDMADLLAFMTSGMTTSHTAVQPR